MNISQSIIIRIFKEHLQKRTRINGCLRLPVRMRSINEKLAERQILYAMELGVNYFDTAVPYHNGKSEPFLGKVLSNNGYRDKIKIATKPPHWSAHSKKDMEGFITQPMTTLIPCNNPHLKTNKVKDKMHSKVFKKPG